MQSDSRPAAGRQRDDLTAGTYFPLTWPALGLIEDDYLHEDGATLAEVAKELGVSPERVRQIERQALRKCRRFCEHRGYRLEELVAAGEWPTSL